MKTIPLQATPSQTLSAVLGGQNCDIAVYQKGSSVYVDLAAGGARVITGRVARNGTPMIMQPSRPFVGNLMFIDTQGDGDPAYTGLGSRYELVYIESADI